MRARSAPPVRQKGPAARPGRRRSTIDWLQEHGPDRTRLLIGGLVGVTLLWLVVAVTVEQVLSRRAPALAMRVAPWSADARTRLAQAEYTHRPAAISDPAIRDLVLPALLRQPVSADAASVLGLSLAAAGRTTQADRVMRYALSLSRRSLTTQIYFIETSVARGDVETTLDHYDQALRTSSRAADVLFPILTAAANQPAIAGPLARRLRQRPIWGRPFMRSFIPAATSPAALYLLSRSIGLADRPSLDVDLLHDADQRLVSLRGFREAGRLYASASGQPDPAVQPVRNGDFEAPAGRLPFDWNLRDEPGLTAVRLPGQRSADGQAVYITASNERGGDVATQLMLLQPGRYAAGAKVGAVTGDPASFPQILVRCEGSNQELAHLPFPRSAAAGSAWTFGFDVPPTCPAQWLVVQAASALDPQPVQPWIDDITIKRSAGR